VAVSSALRDAAASVSSVVEQDRDESGRYPGSLDTVVSRVSPEVAEMVREGFITYWTSPDSLQYEGGYSRRLPSANEEECDEGERLTQEGDERRTRLHACFHLWKK
jgi:hypothetical protein